MKEYYCKMYAIELKQIDQMQSFLLFLIILIYYNPLLHFLTIQRSLLFPFLCPRFQIGYDFYYNFLAIICLDMAFFYFPFISFPTKSDLPFPTFSSLQFYVLHHDRISGQHEKILAACVKGEKGRSVRIFLLDQKYFHVKSVQMSHTGPRCLKAT